MLTSEQLCLLSGRLNQCYFFILSLQRGQSRQRNIHKLLHKTSLPIWWVAFNCKTCNSTRCQAVPPETHIASLPKISTAVYLRAIKDPKQSRLEHTVQMKPPGTANTSNVIHWAYCHDNISAKTEPPAHVPRKRAAAAPHFGRFGKLLQNKHHFTFHVFYLQPSQATVIQHCYTHCYPFTACRGGKAW